MTSRASDGVVRSEGPSTKKSFGVSGIDGLASSSVNKKLVFATPSPSQRASPKESDTESPSLLQNNVCSSQLASPLSMETPETSSSTLTEELAAERLKSAKLESRVQDLTETMHQLEEETCAIHEQLRKQSCSPGRHFGEEDNGEDNCGENGQFTKTVGALENALKVEVQRRLDLERALAEAKFAKRKTGAHVVLDDKAIFSLTEQASKMIETMKQGSGSASLLHMQIEDFDELITSFLSDHGDLDGDEDVMMEQKDVLWFLSELKWRFDEIRQHHVAQTDEMGSFLNVLIGALENLSLLGREGSGNRSDSGCASGLKNPLEKPERDDEVKALQSRISELEEIVEHLKITKEAPPLKECLVEESASVAELQAKMDLLQEAYRENERNSHSAIAEMRDALTARDAQVQALDEKLRRSETTLESTKSDMRKCEEAAAETDKRHMVERMGDKARIKYLEILLRDSQKMTLASKQKAIATVSISARSNDQTAPGAVEANHLSTPRSSMAVDSGNRAVEEDLREQVVLLAEALEKSEHQRAITIVEFQKERQLYTEKFRELSDAVTRSHKS